MIKVNHVLIAAANGSLIGSILHPTLVLRMGIGFLLFLNKTVVSNIVKMESDLQAANQRNCEEAWLQEFERGAIDGD